MSDKVDERRQGSAFERHLQTVVTILVAGLLTWVGLTTNETSKSVAVTEVKMEMMQLSLTSLAEKLDTATLDRYTATDARRDLGAVYRRLDQTENRMTVIESEHSNLMGSR